MAVQGYKFHPLFEHIWQTTASDDALLEEHILKDGEVLDPVVVWKGTQYVVDGHRRLQIADKHDLPYKVIELPFDSEDDVIMWMREHQASRRNIRPDVVLYNMGLVHKFFKDKATDNGEEVCPTKQTSEAYGVTKQTVQNAVKHASNVDALSAPVKEKYLAGSISASVGDVQKLAALPTAKQQQVAKMVETGQAASVSKALGKVAPADPPKKAPSIKAKAAKATATFSDVEIQRTFDAWKKMMNAMPQVIYRNVEQHCAAIYKELMKHQET